MAEWLNYVDRVGEHTVTGDLRILPKLQSPQLKNERDILVWLPPSYDAQPDRRYPVLYMHDGQNLFDAKTSFSGEWRVDETMTALAAEGREAIIVGLPNTGRTRISEYSPFARGDDYLCYITDTVKPIVDADFRTLPDAPHTGLAGSSLGGLITLYGFLSRGDVFGLGGAFSPSFWVGQGRLYGAIDRYAYGSGKLYMDIGTREVEAVAVEGASAGRSTRNARYVGGVARLYERLLQRGYTDDTLLYVEDEGGAHNEQDWARRLPEALRFLLPVIA